MENEVRCASCGRLASELDCDFDYTFETCYSCIDRDIELQEDMAIYEEQERYSGA
ncbi:hypothetical protein EFV12PHI1_108 [Enterococcus phage EfV12-phi1]|uniref:Uncharacterized protein n=2 Tax=Schiekvirus TaxID=2732968 RepID=A0AAE9HDS4_9CAUD|nr:hypothetical protein HOU42_gp028 [Enterococcus phage EfV12-phi1]AYJ73391.1 hypothetical protein EFV12PHI1_108 [Enterococcus phage EfV12-phi1]UPW35262.1 hypothetical protein KEBGJNKE_00023 [Enterococcus phage vB_OCPT_Bop]